MIQIKVGGDAQQLLEQFIYYGEINAKEMADAMFYDYDAFNSRLKQLKRAYDTAQEVSGK